MPPDERTSEKAASPTGDMRIVCGCDGFSGSGRRSSEMGDESEDGVKRKTGPGRMRRAVPERSDMWGPLNMVMSVAGGRASAAREDM